MDEHYRKEIQRNEYYATITAEKSIRLMPKVCIMFVSSNRPIWYPEARYRSGPLSTNAG